MTYADVKKKFLIEYDKANVTSSYPSLTDYEIATILDKAYLALIAEKVTGNNPRRAAFEGDVKVISDIQGLIAVGAKDITPSATGLPSSNTRTGDLPEGFLYFVSAVATGSNLPIEKVELISHESANNFFITGTNMPWFKGVKMIIEGDKFITIYNAFLDTNEYQTRVTFRYIKAPTSFTKDNVGQDAMKISDTACEELINLAIIMALETTESPRLASKVQTRPIES